MKNNGIMGANCINTRMKQSLMDAVGDKADTDIQLSVLLDFIEQLPDCSKVDQTLEPNNDIDAYGTIKEVPKPPRKLSEYQLFIQKCAKGTGKGFSECVTEWKQQKATQSSP